MAKLEDMVYRVTFDFDEPVPTMTLELVPRIATGVNAAGSFASKSDDWRKMASEPSTDEEIESYKRHEGCPGPESCLGCMEKLRLIARIEADQMKMATDLQRERNAYLTSAETLRKQRDSARLDRDAARQTVADQARALVDLNQKLYEADARIKNARVELDKLRCAI